jgi:hypothetical protein
MEAGAKEGRLGDLLWLFFWGVASSVVCVTAADRIGATFDEPLHLQRGLEGWRAFSHRGLIRLGYMPLPADVQTLPLHLAEKWRGRPWDVAEDSATILPWFRAGTLPFWWLLLLYGGLCGRLLGGRWAGRLAVAALACDPNLLAHAGLGGSDIPVTACLVALVYHFRAGREATWPRRVALPALWYGIALLAKASALAFGPLLMLVIELERVARRPRADVPGGAWGWAKALAGDLRPFVREMVFVGFGGLAVAFLYCGCDFQTEPSFVAWAHQLPPGGSHDVMTWLADHLRIFSNAGEALVRQIKHNMHGHGTYILGEMSHTSIWYYFPLLFSIKLPLPPLLLLLGLGALRPRSLVNWATAAAAALLLFSLESHVQIGVRLYLAMVVLTWVGLSAALVETAHALSAGWGRCALTAGAVAAVTWLAWGTLAVWPQDLCYVNPFWGGSRNGYRLVSDSNYDWGQGLPELARWQESHAGERLDVWYFGSDPMLGHLPLRELPLHALPIEGPEDVRRQVHGRYLAVGTTVLYGHWQTEAHWQSILYLRGLRPVDRTTTFLIFDMAREREIAALRAAEGAPESR